MAYIGVSPSNGVRRVFDYTATAGQTSFSGTDNNSQTLAYTDSAYIDVYQNGILLIPSDYTATTGTTVVLDTGATVNDTVQIVAYDVFSVADTVSASDGGSFGGNVGVGGNLSATGTLAVTGATTLSSSLAMTSDDPTITMTDSSGTNDIATIQSTSGALIMTARDGSSDGEIIFKKTDGSATDETFRIRSGGFVRASPNSTVTNSRLSATTAHVFHSHTDGSIMFFLENTQADPYGLMMDFSQASPDDNTNHFLKLEDGSAERCIIYSDGDIKNHDNSYGSLSDERIKDNITDANSQWNDIKALKVKNFQLKDDIRQYGADKAKSMIGVVAQEVESAGMNGLIKYANPNKGNILSDSAFGTVYKDGDDIPDGKAVGDVKEVKEKVKGVSYSVLYMKAIKALQEAMTRIETLEAKVTALESK